MIQLPASLPLAVGLDKVAERQERDRHGVVGTARLDVALLVECQLLSKAT